MSFYAAADEIREAATKFRLPGPRKKLLWATILAQVAKSDCCDGSDGSLANMLLDIIREYLKKPTEQELISMWLQTENGGGDDPETLFVDSVRIDLEMEFLDEVTKVAWAEARPPQKKKKRR